MNDNLQPKTFCQSVQKQRLEGEREKLFALNANAVKTLKCKIFEALKADHQ